MAKEVAPLGIKVTCIEPGGFRTDRAGASITYAPQIDGYEATVGQRTAFFQSGKFVSVGDPEKAANMMIILVETNEPPVHLVLGSEAAGLLKSANKAIKVEFEKWMPVNFKTDHNKAEDFLQTDLRKSFVKS